MAAATLAAAHPVAASVSPAATIVAGHPVGVRAGDYLLTVTNLAAPVTEYAKIAQQLGGTGPWLRNADVLATPSPSTATAQVRIAGPSDTFGLVAAAAPTWSSMTLMPATWRFVVRGTTITAPGGTGVLWHGFNATPQMTDSQYGALTANPLVAVVRLIIDERCWDPYFTAGRTGLCATASGYQAKIIADVSDIIAGGAVALIVPDDAGRDSAGWVPSQQTDDFGPDQHTLALFHQLDVLWGNNPSVVFETMNEPKMQTGQLYPPSNIDGSALWRSGGVVTQGASTWVAPGVQQIVNQIRADGASNLVMVEGLAWGDDLRTIEQAPVVGTNLAYSFHAYVYPDNQPTYAKTLDVGIGPVIDPNGPWQYAGFLSEFGTGQQDILWIKSNGSNYLSSVINWANGHQAGWVAFGWYPDSWNHFGLLSSYTKLNSKGQTVANLL